MHHSDLCHQRGDFLCFPTICDQDHGSCGSDHGHSNKCEHDCFDCYCSILLDGDNGVNHNCGSLPAILLVAESVSADGSHDHFDELDHHHATNRCNYNRSWPRSHNDNSDSNYFHPNHGHDNNDSNHNNGFCDNDHNPYSDYNYYCGEREPRRNNSFPRPHLCVRIHRQSPLQRISQRGGYRKPCRGQGDCVDGPKWRKRDDVYGYDQRSRLLRVSVHGQWRYLYLG